MELDSLLSRFGWCPSGGFTRTLDIKAFQTALQKYQYVRLGILGRGAYGTVYRVMNRETQQMHAVKQVRTTETGLCEATVREIATLRELQHGNIVSLRDVIASPSSSSAYLVMELLDTDLHSFICGLRGAPEECATIKASGRCCCPAARVLPRSLRVRRLAATALHRHVELSPRAPPRLRAPTSPSSIMFQVLSGLQHAHSHSVMHRDLKPQNILLSTTTEEASVGPADAPELATAASSPFSSTFSSASSSSSALSSSYGSGSDGAAAGWRPAGGGRAGPSLSRPAAASVRVWAKIADFGLARPFLPHGPESGAYTDWVITLYYRAPEVLLGSRSYGPGVDVWSAGCVLAEMLNAAPLFRADCEIALLRDMFAKLGTPGAAAAAGLPELARMQASFGFHPQQPMAKLVPALRHDPLGTDLLSRMLAINPLERLSASQALRHPWFDDIREREAAWATRAAARLC
ncbi:hypothetical protein GPECTOR_53g99 [Gonium pectorale]|uniref:cyclin-dependent kinase n=1 Tax=Gonium pectorale TaxID=33097 RepID=A0A150G6W0_GONPE|nr:hypothetical protein GPECTOR_53g99 [Gonium pectorale]|eukprot:KXZ45606.1 hypothetical protein GPECTOR_53g99 [Gonium pectorale]